VRFYSKHESDNAEKLTICCCIPFTFWGFKKSTRLMMYTLILDILSLIMEVYLSNELMEQEITFDTD
jgi:hypothetical protein